MVILFCKLLTPILIKKLGIPKKLIMLDFEGIRIPTLFKIILGAKNSIETWWSRGHHQFDRVKDTISLVESRTPLKYGRVKDSINWVESRTPLKCGRVKDFIDEFEPKLEKNSIW